MDQESQDRQKEIIAFYQENDPILFRYLLSLLGRPTLAEDALQEGWEICLTHRDTFLSLPPDRRLPWMVVVVRNAAFSLLRKEKPHLSLEDLAHLPAPEEDSQGAQGIAAVIRSLPPSYRAVLELKFLLEWSDRDIARYTGLSLTAVSTRVWRGRKLLQEKLREEGYYVRP